MKKSCALFLVSVVLSFTGCMPHASLKYETATNYEDVTEIINTIYPTENSTLVEDFEINQVPDETFVKITDYIPDVSVDLKYATDDNFTGVVIYTDNEAYLRYGTVKKLSEVQKKLKEKGYRLLIWDAYRPVDAQFKLWEACPDPAFVANPNTGFSSHSRGNTVDISLVTEDGSEVLMPTAFDDFSSRADRNYSDISPEARSNAIMLENIMTECGFTGYSAEWWHYSDNTEYPVE